MRHADISHLSFPAAFEKALAPLWLSLAIVAVMSPGLMAISIAEFRKTE